MCSWEILTETISSLYLRHSDALVADEGVLHVLLGDRRAAAVAAADLVPRRARDADRVEAGVRVEAAVLGGEHGLAHVLRHGLDRHLRAVALLGHEPGERVAVGVGEQRDLVVHGVVRRGDGEERVAEREGQHRAEHGGGGEPEQHEPDRGACGSWRPRARSLRLPARGGGRRRRAAGPSGGATSRRRCGGRCASGSPSRAGARVRSSAASRASGRRRRRVRAGTVAVVGAAEVGPRRPGCRGGAPVGRGGRAVRRVPRWWAARPALGRLGAPGPVSVRRGTAGAAPARTGAGLTVAGRRRSSAGPNAARRATARRSIVRAVRAVVPGGGRGRGAAVAARSGRGRRRQDGAAGVRVPGNVPTSRFAPL